MLTAPAIIALVATVADAVTTYIGLRRGYGEANPVLRIFATVGGRRLPWAPGALMLGLFVWCLRSSWGWPSEYESILWLAVAAPHAVVAVLNVKTMEG